LFKLLNKYRPETSIQKKERLTALAAATANGEKADRGKKPVMVKYGINHIAALVEAKKAQLVVIANDVDPIEVIIGYQDCIECVFVRMLISSGGRLGHSQ
jgi:large subunit ribosomal protein L7Ae